MTLSFTTTNRDPCPVCGNPLPPDRDKYCSNKCAHTATHNTARAAASKAHDVEFIGVDGEGINIVHPDGTREHRYVMLSVGDETLWKPEGLTHREIFPFLWQQFLKHPAAVFVGFYLSYDFTMWLKSLAFDKGTRTGAWSLFTKPGVAARQQEKSPIPKPVLVDGWRIDILGMKRFKLQPDETWEERKARKRAKRQAPWMFICDTGAFWQQSLVSAINPDAWNGNPPCTPEEFDTIKHGKGERDVWYKSDDLSYLKDMVRYNILENAVLGRMMNTLDQGFIREGIRLDRDEYYGPGQAAQKWLDTKFDNDSIMRRRVLQETLPHDIIDAFRASYYGGWFEAFYIGHVPGKTYEYDIRSAYPDAMRNLPCLCAVNGWDQGETEDLPTGVWSADIALVYATVYSERYTDVGPLPYRIGSGKHAGTVTHPVYTRGWYLLSEIEAAHRAGLIREWSMERWITYRATCGHKPPLAELADMYERRKAVGKNTPQGKAIKLVLNSMYGKSAQSIGTPKYSNPIYATMITSACRAKMLQAIGIHPKGTDHVVMIATDGIYFRTPNPTLDNESIIDELGGWETGVKHNLTVMKPGVYWDDKARATSPETFKLRSRGINANGLRSAIPGLDAQFDAFQTSLEPSLIPKCGIPAPFSIVSPALALARGKWETCGHVVWAKDERGNVNPEAALTQRATISPKRTHPYKQGRCIRTETPGPWERRAESEPYSKDFGFELSIEERDAEQLLTPSGNIVRDFAHALDLKGTATI